MFDPRRLLGGGAVPRPAAATKLARDPAAREALALLARGRAEAALAAFDAILAEERLEAATEAEARNKRGVALVALERRDEALASFAAALARDETCAAALVNLGNLLLEDGATADAIDFYAAAVAADAGCLGAHRGLGVAYKRLGRRSDAVRAFKAEARHTARRG